MERFSVIFLSLLRNLIICDMANKIVYPTQGVCSQAIVIELDDNNIVKEVEFMGGCSGNTQGVAKLAKGMNAEEVISCLGGISCNGKPTSCPDQLCCAIEQLMKEE